MRWQMYRFNITIRNGLKWPPEMRQVLEAKASEGWELASASAFRDTDGSFVEVLWLKRPLPEEATGEPEHGWLGFGPPGQEN